MRHPPFDELIEELKTYEIRWQAMAIRLLSEHLEEILAKEASR